MTTAHRLTALLGAAMLVVGLAAPSFASDPESQEATAPSEKGETVEVDWTGTIPPGSNDDNECEEGPTTDQHTIELTVPEGVYEGDGAIRVEAVFTIDYTGATDQIISVVKPDGTKVSGDSGFVDAAESIAVQNPPSGTYLVLACSFASTLPQDYTGTLVMEGKDPLTTAGAPFCDPPSKSLKFEERYIDETRAGGEPIMDVHPDGTILWGSHAGTTHFFGPAAPDPQTAAFLENYQGQTYQYFSEDGETFEFVPRNPIQSDPLSGLPNSGFSDPEFAIDAAGNVFISEINLVNVAVSKSTDSGRTYTLQNFFAFTQSDRQWMAADEEDVLYMTANGFGGGSTPTDPVGELSHFIAKSVDGGVTWGPAQTPNTDGVADIQVDPRTGTLYEITATTSGTISMAAYRGIRDLAPEDDFAEVLEHHTIVEGVGLTSIGRLIDPTFDMDDEGNLYIVWSDNGTGSRPAGVYYSYSTDEGRSWAEPVRVDPDANTEAWPWLAVGDPGEVAIVYLATDTELENNNAELAADDDVWTVDVAWTEHGLGCEGTPTPAFRIEQASAEHVHSGTICQGGTLCQAQLVDRRLGDYFANEVDLDGGIHISVSDTRQGGAVALPLHIRQVGGPPLTGGATPPSTTSPPQPAPEPDDQGPMPATGGGLALAGIGLLALAGIGSWARRRRDG